jgi:CRP-like cAMP-binding protein
MEEYFDLLLESPLFAGISREELSLLLGCLQVRLVAAAKGEPVFLEGEPAGFVGMVLEGGVQIVQDDYFGNRSVLAHAQRGEIFAEAFACAGVETMPVSAMALQSTKAALFDCRKMLTVCTGGCRFHNQLVKNLLQVVAHKNLAQNRKIRIMSRKTTREKLMAFFLEQAKAAGAAEFTIPFDRQTLADYLGVERSAMSAELGKLRRDGVLGARGARVCLLDTAAQEMTGKMP